MSRLRDVHGGEIRSIRNPLCAALDLEYVRAANKKDTGRMGEIMTIMELLNNLWPDKIPLAAPSGTPILAMPAPTQIPPAPRPPDGPRPGWVKEVLRSSDRPAPDPLEQPPEPEPTLPAAMQPQVDDQAARRAAKARIMNAAHRQSMWSAEQELGYQEALMAHNRNVAAMDRMAPRAQALGIPIATLVEQIVAERDARARRLLKVKRLEDTAVTALDGATGTDIAKVEAEYVAQIEGDDGQ